MNFSDVKSVTIPEGVVTEIKQGDTVLWKAKTKRLPDAYQEVEWIKPLNAKLSLPANTMDYGYASFKVSFPKEDYGVSYTLAWGGSTNESISSFHIDGGAVSNTYRVSFYLTNNDIDGVTDNKKVFTTGLDPSTTIVAKWDGDNLILGDKTASASTLYASSPWYLFGKQDEAYNYDGKLQVYEISMGLYTFVPCYRKSDNVIGMCVIGRTNPSDFYTFLTSETGSFEKGADV